MFGLAVILLPMLIGAIVFFLRAPEAGKRFSVTGRLVVIALCLLTAFVGWKQQREDAEAREKQSKLIESLRTVSALRKQSADLATEMLDFYHKREHYKDRFKPWQEIDAAEYVKYEKWYAETVAKYNEIYEPRVISLLTQINKATGVNVTALSADAKGVKRADDISQVATRLAGLAASLP